MYNGGLGVRRQGNKRAYAGTETIAEPQDKRDEALSLFSHDLTDFGYLYLCQDIMD